MPHGHVVLGNTPLTNRNQEENKQVAQVGQVGRDLVELAIQVCRSSSYFINTKVDQLVAHTSQQCLLYSICRHPFPLSPFLTVTSLVFSSSFFHLCTNFADMNIVKRIAQHMK